MSVLCAGVARTSSQQSAGVSRQRQQWLGTQGATLGGNSASRLRAALLARCPARGRSALVVQANELNKW